jgi:5'(3')-deoxyribonucleotidase
MKLIFENWRRFLKEEEEQRPLHIFFDMDGVLVDFAGTVAKKINENLAKARTTGGSAAQIHPDSPTRSQKSNRKNLQKLVRMGIKEVTPTQLEEINVKKDNKEKRSPEEKRIDDYLFSLINNDEQIWLGMDKVAGADEMIETAGQIAGPENVYILSSPVDEVSVNAKREWIEKHFPGRFPKDRVILTGEKGDALKNLGIVQKGDIAILIDDRFKYINQFQQAGGQIIHHYPPGEGSVSKTIERLKEPWIWKKPSRFDRELGFALKEIEIPPNIGALISAAQQKYSNILPEGEKFTKIDNPHVTLIAGKDYKPLSKEQKENLIQTLEEGLPEAVIDSSQAFLATRNDGRKTLYLKIQNSPQLNEALKTVLGEKWPDKYMHLSIANVHEGTSFKSVGDINQTDEGEEKIIIPIAQPKKPPAPPTQQTKVEIPIEIHGLGNILRAAMKGVAAIYPSLQRVKNNERALQGIINGVLKNKLGLDDNQIEAILDTL